MGEVEKDVGLPASHSSYETKEYDTATSRSGILWKSSYIK